MKDASQPDLSPGIEPAAPPLARWALLVDGENMPHTYADRIMGHVRALGKATVRRVYCDPVEQQDWAGDARLNTVYSGSAGAKNAADIRLVIGAMDLAYARAVDGFVIVSKDGDFAPLATRLCDMGYTVLGIGCRPASEALRYACTEFVTLAEDGGDTTVQRGSVKLDEIEAMLVKLIKEHGTGGLLPISKINGLVRIERPSFRISATDEKTWRTYLGERPHLFRCQQRGPDACVRLQKV